VRQAVYLSADNYVIALLYKDLAHGLLTEVCACAYCRSPGAV